MQRLESAKQTTKHWYGLRIPVPQYLIEEAEKLMAGQEVIEKTMTNDMHITLIYGNKEEDYDSIRRLVEHEELTTHDLTFGGFKFVQPLHTKNKGEAYLVVDVVSERLANLKRRLELQYLGQERNIPNHVTLAKMKRLSQLEAFGDVSCIVQFRHN